MASPTPQPTTPSNGGSTKDKYQANIDAANGAVLEAPVAAEALWRPTFLREEHARWNQLFPYQFIVVERSQDRDGKTQWKRAKKWDPFTLPLSPESISMSYRFASSLTVTLGGVTEEKNGIPLVSISINGSMGVLPAKPQGRSVSRSAGRTIFGGTASSIDQLGRTVKTLQTSFSSGPIEGRNSVDADSEADGLRSGYVQFNVMLSFIRSYERIKKTAAGRKLQMAFACWKDQHVYLVSMNGLGSNRNGASPYEYPYSLQMTGFGTIDLDKGASPEQFASNPRDPSEVSRALNTIRSVRQIVEGAATVLSSIVPDLLNSCLEPLRETMGFLKAGAGFPVTVADLGKNFAAASAGAVTTHLNSGSDLASSVRVSFGTIDNSSQIAAEFDRAKKAAGIIEESNATNTSPGRGKVVKDREPSALRGAGVLAGDSSFGFRDAIQVDSLPLSTGLSQQAQKERRRMANLGRADFNRHQLSITRTKELLEDALGLSDPTYNALFGRTSGSKRRDPSDDDLKVLAALSSAVTEMKKLMGYTNIKLPTRLRLYSQLAQQIGYPAPSTGGKYAVPWPYGFTLEKMALRYLGNADRWGEIVALNGLESPYVDEEGFEVALVANGSGDTVIVDVDNRFYADQVVTVHSSAAVPTKRVVISVETVGGFTHLRLDGEQDMGDMLVTDGAKIHGFLRNTINSLNTIFIPTDAPAHFQEDGQATIPGVTFSDQFFNAIGVDLMLDEKNDLVITKDGDTRFVTGISNYVQRARVRISTPLGSLVHAPNVGLPRITGDSWADVNQGEFSQSVKNLFKDDPAFRAVEGIQIRTVGGSQLVDMVIHPAGVDEILPMTFEYR